MSADSAGVQVRQVFNFAAQDRLQLPELAVFRLCRLLLESRILFFQVVKGVLRPLVFFHCFFLFLLFFCCFDGYLCISEDFPPEDSFSGLNLL